MLHAFIIAVKVIVAFLPIIIFEVTGYRRWKKRYGKGSYFHYYYRFGGVRHGTEDFPVVFILKSVFSIVWLTAFAAYFIEGD